MDVGVDHGHRISGAKEGSAAAASVAAAVDFMNARLCIGFSFHG